MKNLFTWSGLTFVLLAISSGCMSPENTGETANGRPTTGRLASLTAKPGLVILDTAKTAVIVVDMQNDFAAKGGMLDREGIDIAQIQKAVAPTARTLAAARKAGIQIVYLKMAYRPDLSDMGPPGSPN